LRTIQDGINQGVLNGDWRRISHGENAQACRCNEKQSKVGGKWGGAIYKGEKSTKGKSHGVPKGRTIDRVYTRIGKRKSKISVLLISGPYGEGGCEGDFGKRKGDNRLAQAKPANYKGKGVSSSWVFSVFKNDKGPEP